MINFSWHSLKSKQKSKERRRQMREGRDIIVRISLYTVWPEPIWIKVKKSWLLLPQHQGIFPRGLLHKIIKNWFFLGKSCFTMFTFRGTFYWVNLSLKGGISIDADSGPLGYLLWCLLWYKKSRLFYFYLDWLWP